jgi:hypothetical protein
MSGIIFITAGEAEQRVNRMGARILDFLAEFNAMYPDRDAKAVSSHFDYFTKNYVFKTCASVLSQKLIISPQQNMSPVMIEAKAEAIQQFSKDRLKIFPEDRDEVEAS